MSKANPFQALKLESENNLPCIQCNSTISSESSASTMWIDTRSIWSKFSTVLPLKQEFQSHAGALSLFDGEADWQVQLQNFAALYCSS
jgi:hypothetical protein